MTRSEVIAECLELAELVPERLRHRLAFVLTVEEAQAALAPVYARDASGWYTGRDIGPGGAAPIALIAGYPVIATSANPRGKP